MRRFSVIIAALVICIGIGRARAQRPLGMDSDFHCCSVDFETAAANGIQFACIKATALDEGFSNSVFAARMSAAHAAGVYTIPYNRCNPSTNEPRTEAIFFWSWASNSIAAGGYNLSPALDVEDGLAGPYIGDNGASISLSGWCNEWYNDVSNYAAAAGIHLQQITYVNAGSSCYLSTAIGGSGWVAWTNCDYNIPQTGTPWCGGGCEDWGSGAWSIWQYAWDQLIPGPTEHVDLNVYNGTLAQMVATLGTTTMAPAFTQPPPANVTVNGGGTLVIPAAAFGVAPLGYQWTELRGGTNVGMGSTNAVPLDATLTVSNVPYDWNNDSLRLTVTNLYGSTNVTVTLTVFTNAPQITQDLPPQITLISGHTYTYSIGASGAAPFIYQWYNAATPIAGQTNATYTATAGSPGSTATYYVVITNYTGGATSSISTVTSIAPLTNSYATRLLQFNPVGYWPMHEVEAPAPGDIETNYGTLGLLGTGFYPDWVSNTAVGAFQRQFPGALAGDKDKAVFFTEPASNSGGPTNALYVPHTSPASTLNPPFSVECWFYGTNGNQGDIWSQAGYEGLNAGNSGGGVGNVSGIRLYWNPGFSVYTYYNGSTLHNIFGTLAGTTTIGKWYHVVVTCDAHTNLSIFVNGSEAFTNQPAVGLYSPDYWTPFEVGNGRGNTRGVQGIVDEVAVYTNVLADASAHYAAGINANPSPTYFQLVTNDKPAIYLRMDSAAYTPPAFATWPVLTNYGSVALNGVYNPGTMPGIVPGPADTNSVPFNGLANAAGTKVPQFSGVSSFADVGYAAAFNPIGATPFTVAAMFRGNPCDNRFQSIVGHSDNSWRIAMNTNGTLQGIAGTNSSGMVNSTGVYNDGNWHQVVEVYTPASVPTVTGTNALYVDGELDTAVSTVSTNGIGPGSSLDVLIASDPQYTNAPVGLGRQFAGQVCEVAWFTNALTAAQIQQIYNAAFFTAPAISMGLSGGNPMVTFTGTLVSSTNVAGPYQPVSSATSPYAIPATNAQQFYRAMVSQ